jgi:methylmalonyl-CoA/ethylmalonyl-CoA epimerase
MRQAYVDVAARGGPATHDAGDLSFHHLGIACERVEAEAETWSLLGYRAEGGPFEDPGQGIRGAFMVGPGPRLELLEPTPGSDTLAPWLKRRIKVYHSGYMAAKFDETLARLCASGAAMAREPMHSVYFQGRIAFLMLPNMSLIELIEPSVAS